MQLIASDFCLGVTRGEFSRLVMRCVKWDGYITRFWACWGWNLYL